MKSIKNEMQNFEKLRKSHELKVKSLLQAKIDEYDPLIKVDTYDSIEDKVWINYQQFKNFIFIIYLRHGTYVLRGTKKYVICENEEEKIAKDELYHYIRSIIKKILLEDD